MEAMHTFRRREGAISWGLFRDLADPDRYVETFLVTTWAEHMRQPARVTADDQAIEARAFAFDEVLRASQIDTRTRLMVKLAAMIAAQALREYRVMLGAALAVGVTPVEIKEIVYQAVPYVGLAKVYDFIHATNEVLIERGISLPLPSQSTTTPETRAARGLAVQQQTIGETAV
jgi:alkylhydroperoxidase/carboxymuconolactone decarboxylase family protein YurZ